LTNAELVQLRIRVIALENLVITLLAEASDRQLALAREMAAYISPRPGFTHHPLTIHAAAQMIDLVERAGRFRSRRLHERRRHPYRRRSEVILEPGDPAFVLPDEPHFGEPVGPMRVEFCNQLPDL
jgi:hypothetical protein